MKDESVITEDSKIEMDNLDHKSPLDSIEEEKYRKCYSFIFSQKRKLYRRPRWKRFRCEYG